MGMKRGPIGRVQDDKRAAQLFVKNVRLVSLQAQVDRAFAKYYADQRKTEGLPDGTPVRQSNKCELSEL